jgi:cytoskeletal protein RodZ
MSPKAQAAVGLVVGGVILIAAAYVLTTGFWWMIFIFGWAVFPALGLLAKGVAGIIDSPKEELPAANSRERELLEAVERNGEVTPARVAMETSLTVDEADRMLSALAEKGHLEVRVRGGGLVYAMWEQDRREIIG